MNHWLQKETRREGTHESDKSNTEFTNLLDDALCCAIVPCHNDAVMGPSDIEDAPHGLQDIECEKGELSNESDYEMDNEETIISTM